MTDRLAEIQGLHAAYTRLTGLAVRLDIARERDWWDWLARGFTAPDLETVIRFHRANVKEPRILGRMLRFGFLIGQPDRFEEDLAEARALGRPKPSPVQTIKTGATERIVPATGTQDASRSAGGIMRGLAPGSLWDSVQAAMDQDDD